MSVCSAPWPSLDPLTLLDGNAFFTEFKGSLAEQFVLQSLIASNQKPYYWTNKNGATEIDFHVERPTSIIPLEVKSA
jgi:predicted AAA+ superfamily ATPase